MKTLKYFIGLMLLVSLFGFGLNSCKGDDKKPDGPDFTADYPDAPKVDGKITIFAKFGVAPCGDVVLDGSHNLVEGTTDWRTDNPQDMGTFVSAGVIDGKDWGAEGWYKVTISVPESAAIPEHSAILGAKPVQLKDGAFNWDYQIGYFSESDVEVKSGDVDVEAGFTNECNIYFLSNATAAIIFNTWKKNPCVAVSTHDYTFSVTVPEGTPDDADIYIAGAMNGWDTQADKLTKGADGKYSITLNGIEEGTEYKYVMNGTWDNAEMKAAEDGADCADDADNRSTGSSTTINDVVANWKGITTCIPSDVTHDYTFIVTVPEGTPADADVYIAGAMNGWTSDANKLTKNADGTYSITLNDVPEGTEYKYLLNGTWDNEELTATGDAGCADAISNRTTGTDDTINDTVENWKAITADRCE